MCEQTLSPLRRKSDALVPTSCWPAGGRPHLPSRSAWACPTRWTTWRGSVVPRKRAATARALSGAEPVAGARGTRSARRPGHCYCGRQREHGLAHRDPTSLAAKTFLTELADKKNHHSMLDNRTLYTSWAVLPGMRQKTRTDTGRMSF